MHTKINCIYLFAYYCDGLFLALFFHSRQPATSEVFSKVFNILRAVAQELTMKNPPITFPQLLRSAVEHQFYTAFGKKKNALQCTMQTIRVDLLRGF